MSADESARPVWSKLVLTTDFSDDSFIAWREAKRIIGLESVEITLVHVSEPPFAGLRIQTEAIHQRTRHDAFERMQLFAAKHFGIATAVTIRVEEGHPASAICEVARDIRADLIIISSRGQSQLTKLLLGSVVEGVLRQSRCATLVLPATRSNV